MRYCALSSRQGRNGALIRILLLLLLVLPVSAVQAASTFYVYRDHQGNRHMSDTVPGEYVRYGYRIVNQQGVTLRTVPPQRGQAKSKQAPGLSERDKRLLKTYTSVEDIEISRDQQARILRQQVDYARSNLALLRKNLADLEGQWHRYQQSADEMPFTLERDIGQLKQRIQKGEVRLRKKLDEQKRINQRFDADLQRFRRLKAAQP